METIRSLEQLRQSLGDARCVLVPTMGALHQGHLSLAERGKLASVERDCPLVVSIFVNPAQFNDRGDLARYPRPERRDLAMLAERGVDIAFVPAEEAMYPPSQPNVAPQVSVPSVGRLPGLEDRYRPGHFEGVCRVVSRLFDVCTPSAAVFGEKDWQQARVVSAMCREQGRDTDIVIGPTVREHDGLAMSSRNEHLTSTTRTRASAIWAGFQAALVEHDLAAAEHAIAATMTDAGFAVEYATIRDAETLMPSQPSDTRPLRMLAAGVLEGVRLLDNAPWPA